MDANLLYAVYVLCIVVIVALMFRGGGKGTSPGEPRFGA